MTSPPQLVYCAVSKPKFDLATWHAVRVGWARIASGEPVPADAFGEPIVRSASRPNFVHPAALDCDNARDAFLSAFTHTRAAAAVLRELPELSDHHTCELQAQFHTAYCRIASYAHVSESGACLILSLIEVQSADVIERFEPQKLRAFLNRLFHTPPTGVSGPRPDDTLSETTEALFGFRPDFRFRKGSTYLVTFLDEDAAAKLDYKSVHRLEDGATDDASEALKVRELDILYAFAGWGHSTFVARSVPLAMFLLPGIVSVDGTYAVTTFQLEQLVGGSATRAKRLSIAEMEREIASFENYAFDAEMAEIEFENVRQQFKPWQRGVHDHLFVYWRLRQASVTLQKALRHRLERERGRLTVLVARMERRRNIILGLIALLELVAVSSSLVAYLELIGRSSRVELEGLYASGPYFFLVLAIPASVLLAVGVFWVLLTRRPVKRKDLASSSRR